MRICLLTISLLLGPWTGLPAHGDLHGQIEDVSGQILAQPADAGLYVKRGNLRRWHEEFRAAEEDYRRALDLQPDLVEAHFGLASLALAAGRPGAGLDPAERFLRVRPGDEKGLGLRARLLAALGRHGEAAAAFALALEAGPSAESVDYCLERARSLEEAGRAPEAVAALDAGRSRLGDLIVLEEEALGLERRLGRLADALRRNSRMLQAAARREQRLLVQGEILEGMGRRAAARRAWREALDEIARLPEQRRLVPALRNLETRLRALLSA